MATKKELSILIVDDDPLILRAMSRDIAREGVKIVTAQSLNEALPHLLSYTVDILLTDLRMTEGDGTELLWVVHNNALKTRTILMSGAASDEDKRLAFRLGAVAVLEKPVSNEVLAAALSRALDGSSEFSGELYGVSLIDVMQLYHLNRRSVVIEVADPRGICIYMRQGEVFHATYGNETGEAAFRRVLRLQHGRLRSAPLLRQPEPSIARRFDSLLLDALRLNDEDQHAMRGERDVIAA